MKKLFTLIAAMMLFVGGASLNAKKTIPNFTPSTMTFASWTWNNVSSLGSGEATNAGDGKADGSGITYYDGSAHDYIIIEYSAATVSNVQGIVQYNCNGVWGQWGAEFYNTTVPVITNSTGGIIALKLDIDRSDKLYTVAIQDTGSSGTMDVKDAYFATEEEYEEVKKIYDEIKNNNKPTHKALTLDDLGSGWGDGTTYDAATKTITIGADWSGKGWWLDKADYSDFDMVWVKFATPTEATGKVVVEYNDGTNNGDEGLFEVGTKEVVCKLSAAKNSVKQIYIQGPAGSKYVLESAVVCTQAYFDAGGSGDTKVEYETEGKNIPFDEWGNILASEFEGYPDNAKVVFTYTTEGELTNDAGSIVGWGIGSISGLGDNSIKVAEISAKAVGDNEITFLLSDLKVALAAGPDQYGRYGLYWNMWAQGNSKNTRKSVVIYNVKGTGISAIDTAKPVQNDVIYNLAGQKVDNSYKGVVIKNGKKFFQK